MASHPANTSDARARTTAGLLPCRCMARLRIVVSGLTSTVLHSTERLRLQAVAAEGVADDPSSPFEIRPADEHVDGYRPGDLVVHSVLGRRSTLRCTVDLVDRERPDQSVGRDLVRCRAEKLL